MSENRTVHSEPLIRILAWREFDRLTKVASTKGGLGLLMEVVSLSALIVGLDRLKSFVLVAEERSGAGGVRVAKRGTHSRRQKSSRKQ